LSAANATAQGTPYSTETYETLDLSSFTPFYLTSLDTNDFVLLATTQVFLTHVGFQAYSFAVQARAGAQLSIDGRVIISIDQLNSPGPLTQYANVSLLPGAHVVQVLYYNHADTPILEVYMDQTPGAFSTFPLSSANLLRGSETNTYAPANNVDATWIVPVLRVGQTATLQAFYSVDQSAADGSAITDTASCRQSTRTRMRQRTAQVQPRTLRASAM
jgi:hypothetical protein